MLVSPRFLRFLGLLAWGIAFFELTVRAEVRHDAVTELCGLVPMSSDMFAWSRYVDWATFLGISTGFALFGFLADRFGRFRILLWGLAALPLLSGLSGVVFGIADFLLLRLFFGVAAGGVLLSSGILLFESLHSDERVDALLTLPLGGMLGVLLSLLLGNVAKTLSFFPYSEWRIAFFVQAFPVLIVPFLRPVHDEPKCWKTAVRDASMERKRKSKALASGRRRNFLFGILISLAVIGGLSGIVDRQTEQFRRASRSSGNDWLRNNDAFRTDAALVYFLFRHPAVLDMQGIESGNIAGLPDLLRNFIDDEDDWPACLTEGIFVLHEAGKPIDESSLVDQALERRNFRQSPDRPASAISLPEIEAFSRKTTEYLELGKRAFGEREASGDDNISGTKIWRNRLERTQSLLKQIREQIQSRYESTESLIRFNELLFIFGGLFGLWLFRRERLQFGTKRTVLTWFSFLTCLSFAVAGRSNLSTTCFGILGIPLLAIPALMLPAFFRTPRRASACGLCLAVAGAAVFLLRLTAFPFELAAFGLGAATMLCVDLRSTAKCSKK